MEKFIKHPGEIEQNLHKPDIVELAKVNAQSIIDQGNFDILRTYVELKRYEIYIKGLIDHLKTLALDKATENGQKRFYYEGARVNITTRTVWDYTGDTKWSELKLQLESLNEARKEREKFLVSTNQIRTVVNPETGEITEESDLPKEVIHGITITI